MEIASLAQHQLDQATALSEAENWPHRLEDWQMLTRLSQGRAALRDGVVIGTALRTDYGPDVALLNMIIVRRSERGQGIGYKLMPWLEDRGLKCIDTVTRMRKNPRTNPRPVFGHCSQALG